MKLISFSKYSGCGNDFIIIDNRNKVFPPVNFEIRRLCNRREGIGADGLISLEKSQLADYRMRIFNADGSEAEMCGNGIRCLIKFIEDLEGVGVRDRWTIETMEQVLTAQKDGQDIAIHMGVPTEITWDLLLQFDDCLSPPLTLHCINTGVPHAIEFVKNIDTVDIAAKGPLVRNHHYFSPKGTNYNAVQIRDKTIAVRTYERGVEEETPACGTGATAAAIAAAKVYGLKPPITVEVRSGSLLKINFTLINDTPECITMSGPVTYIFSGTIKN